MSKTIHTGDCSSECDTCAYNCAESQHDGCIGTALEREYADYLFNGPSEEMRLMGAVPWNSPRASARSAIAWVAATRRMAAESNGD